MLTSFLACIRHSSSIRQSTAAEQKKEEGTITRVDYHVPLAEPMDAAYP
jgi:hypothetical protein